MRHPLRLAFVLALTLLAAACGGDSGTDDPSEEAPAATEDAAESSEEGATTEEAAAPSGEATTVSLWVNREQYLPTPGFYEALGEEHPEITVEAELVPDDDLFFQLIRMREAGEDLPDLVQLDDFFAVAMTAAELQVPLNDYVEAWEAEDPEGFAAVSPNAIFTDAEGTVVGITPVAQMDVMYTRTDWLEEGGASAPFTSWAQLLDGLRAIHEAQPDVTPIALPAGRGSQVNWFISMLAAMGTEFDGSVPDLTGEGGVAAIDFLQTLSREGLTTEEQLAWTDDESRGAWIGGDAAVTYDSMRSVNDLGGELTATGVEYGDGWAIFSAPLALEEGGDEVGTHLLGTRTYHITSTSDVPDQAFTVLQELMSPERAVEQLDVSNIPLQPAVLASPEFAELQPYIPPDMTADLLAGTQRPNDEHFFEVIELLEQIVQDALSNPDEDPAAMAARWQEQLDAVRD